MKTNLPSRHSRLAMLVPLALAITTSQASMVAWGPATDIIGNADVSLNGTLIAAHNFNGPATTVNGVMFQPFAMTASGNGSVTVGNYTITSGYFTGAMNTGSPGAAFTGLTPEYQRLLGSAAGGIADLYLTLGGLTPGRSYEFQTWVNNSEGRWHYGVYLNDGQGNGVDLSGGGGSDEPADGLGPVTLGQYVIGTFTADAATQQVIFEVDEIAYSNGFQLRDVTTVAVPEPGTLISGFLAVGAMAAYRFFRVRKS